MSDETKLPAIVEPSNADLQKQIAALNLSMLTLTISVTELTTIMNNAKGITSFIRWSAGISASLAVVWATLHGVKTP